MKKLDLSKLNIETLRMLIKCKNIDEFRKYIRENAAEYSEEEADEVYQILKTDLEALSDEQLSAIAGGAGTGYQGQGGSVISGTRNS